MCMEGGEGGRMNTGLLNGIARVNMPTQHTNTMVSIHPTPSRPTPPHPTPPPAPCSLSGGEAYSDDEDMSWKVRRASAKLLSAIIGHYPDLVGEVCVPGVGMGGWVGVGGGGESR
jgi:hypothetical protein